MSDRSNLGVDRHPGPNYRDIIRTDPGPLNQYLALESNPPQSTADIAYERYTSKAFFDEEMQKMWRRVWQYACRVEHVGEEGDYFVYDIGRISILITRAQDGIKAYYNSCLHRGTKLKPSGGGGWSPSLQCPFHGWDWHLDGSVKNIPCKWDFAHVDEAKFRLPEVRVDVWNGMVFICLDPESEPLMDYLGVLPQHFEKWGLDNWYLHLHTCKELTGNWKLVREAFAEAYHGPFVHPEMCLVLGDVIMQYDSFGPNIARSLTPYAIPSPAAPKRLSEQELLDGMLTDPSLHQKRLVLKDGETARAMMASKAREQMLRDYGIDCSDMSNSEMLDSLQYHIFPNIFLFAGTSLRMIQRARPIGNDPERSTYEVMIFRPVPPGQPAPPPADAVHLREDESLVSVDGFNPFLGMILEQDTNIMRLQHEGMHSSAKLGETLGRYQESPIRVNSGNKRGHSVP